MGCNREPAGAKGPGPHLAYSSCSHGFMTACPLAVGCSPLPFSDTLNAFKCWVITTPGFPLHLLAPGVSAAFFFFFSFFFFSIFFSCFFVVTFLLPHRVLSHIQISSPVFFLSWYKTQKIYRLKHIFFRLKHFSASSSVAWSDLFPVVGKHISRTSWSFKTETLCPLTNNSPPLLPQPCKHPSTFCLDESDYCRYFM